MATAEYVKHFEDQSKALLAWKPRLDSLISRPVWGDCNFISARPVIERLFQMVEDLSELSIELIDDNTLATFHSDMNGVESIFQQIDALNTAAAAVNSRDIIAGQLSAHHNQMLSVYKQEVP